MSTGSVRSLGLGALRELATESEAEREEPQARPKERMHRHSGDSGIASGTSASGHSTRSSVVAEFGWHSTVPAVPGLSQRSRSPRKYSSLRVKPSGEWI